MKRSRSLSQKVPKVCPYFNAQTRTTKYLRKGAITKAERGVDGSFTEFIASSRNDQEREADKGFRADYQRILPGGVPFPLPPVSFETLKGDDFPDDVHPISHKQNETFQVNPVPTFSGSASVVRDWEDRMGADRTLPRGVEDRWRSFPPIAVYPVVDIKPPNFAKAVIKNLEELAKLQKRAAKQTNGQDKSWPLYEGDAVHAQTRPQESLSKFVASRLECVEEVVSGTTDYQACETPFTSNNPHPQDVCYEAVLEIDRVLLSDPIRLPDDREAVNTLLHEAIGKWEKDLHQGGKKHLVKLRRIDFEHEVRRQLVARGEATAEESKARSRRTVVVANPTLPLTVDELTKLMRRKTILESQRLLCDFGATRFAWPKLTTRRSDNLPPHLAIVKDVEENASLEGRTAIPFVTSGYSRVLSVNPRNCRWPNNSDRLPAELLGSIVVSVSLYHQTTGKLSVTYDLMDNQTLADLHGIIRCEQDRMRFPVDFHEPPALFFINGNTYVLQNCQDGSYSNSNRSPDSVMYNGETFSMADTRLCDLQIPLMRTFFYVHRGDCEHRLVFHSMRFHCALRLYKDGRGVDPHRSDATGAAKRALNVEKREKTEHGSLIKTEVNSTLISAKLTMSQDLQLTGYDCPYMEGYPTRIAELNTGQLFWCELCVLNQPSCLAFNVSIGKNRNPMRICEECRDIFLTDDNGKYMDPGIAILPLE